jgi:hypothetical protein
VHPHEAAVGLLALVHGATTQEIRHLTVSAIDTAREAVHLPGRSLPTPLDSWSWAAIQRCLDHRRSLNTDNPHGAAVADRDGEVWLDAQVQVDRADFGLTWNVMGLVSRNNTVTIHAVFTKRSGLAL